jgi:transposase-like protein
MTAGSSIDPAEFLRDELAQASPDLLRELMEGFINTLLSADADSVCGAAYGTRDAGRVNRRNGYRYRDLDTRVGTLDVAVPKLRAGSYFPEWLLERRRRAEAALTSVAASSSTPDIYGMHWSARISATFPLRRPGRSGVLARP